MATNGSGNSVSIRDERGRYLKGMAGGPGRPPGSRNRLTERHAVEVAITDEAIGKLTEISRSRTEAASRVARAQMLLRYAEKPSFYAVGQRAWGSIIRRYSAASNGRWPMVRPLWPSLQRLPLGLLGMLQRAHVNRVIPRLARDTGEFLGCCGRIGARTMKYAHLP